MIHRSVCSLAVDPSNEWFATGSADRTIKVWDLVTGQLKVTLTGHNEQVGIPPLASHTQTLTRLPDRPPGHISTDLGHGGA